jgi:hypothetical protein
MSGWLLSKPRFNPKISGIHNMPVGSAFKLYPVVNINDFLNPYHLTEK